MRCRAAGPRRRRGFVNIMFLLWVLVILALNLYGPLLILPFVPPFRQRSCGRRGIKGLHHPEVLFDPFDRAAQGCACAECRRKLACVKILWVLLHGNRLLHGLVLRSCCLRVATSLSAGMAELKLHREARGTGTNAPSDDGFLDTSVKGTPQYFSSLPGHLRWARCSWQASAPYPIS